MEVIKTFVVKYNNVLTSLYETANGDFYVAAETNRWGLECITKEKALSLIRL